MLSGGGFKQDPVPKALLWHESDAELGLRKPYEDRVSDDMPNGSKRAFDRPLYVDPLRKETWPFVSVDKGDDWFTIDHRQRAPSPEARARADEIISAFDGWYKEPKPRRGHKKALREARKVDNEIFDLASQIADVECRTAGGLCEKIRALMVYDSIDAIEKLSLDEGISSEIGLSIFRDLFSMAGKAATS
jgi:hypothetical protein